jgi:hypothetical protein
MEERIVLLKKPISTAKILVFGGITEVVVFLLPGHLHIIIATKAPSKRSAVIIPCSLLMILISLFQRQWPWPVPAYTPFSCYVMNDSDEDEALISILVPHVVVTRDLELHLKEQCRPGMLYCLPVQISFGQLGSNGEELDIVSLSVGHFTPSPSLC